MPTLIMERDDPSWGAYRQTGIGASEAAAACGLSQYQTARELYERKIGNMPPIEDNDAMELGRALEPIVLNRYERERGVKLARRNMGLYCGAHPWLLATPDAEENDTTGVEAKTTSFFRYDQFGEPGTDEVPTDMLMQCQHQMAVMGWTTVHLPVLFDARKLAIYTVQRNQDLINAMLIQEAEFWRRVCENDPPAHDWTHPATPELVKYLCRDVIEGAVVRLDDELSAMWREQSALRDTIKEAEARREVCRAKVIEAMGGASVAIVPGQVKVIRRKATTRAAYSVEATTYVDLREVNPPKEGKK